MKKTLILSALVIGAVTVRADQNMAASTASSDDSSVFQASLTPAIAIHPRTTTIHGLSLNIWGENPLHGAAFGIVNGSTGDSVGFNWGMYNYCDSFTGVQWGIVNYSKESFKGWQGGMVNISKGKFIGFQDGWVNISEDIHGLQWGLVNYTEKLRGVQLGLVNIDLDNGWFNEMPDKFAKGFPIFNWSF